jgi:hypothetical protein
MPRQGMYGDEPRREMRHGYGSRYTASDQAKLPEPAGRRPLGDKPLAGYDIENKPRRRRR